MKHFLTWKKALIPAVVPLVLLASACTSQTKSEEPGGTGAQTSAAPEPITLTFFTYVNDDYFNKTWGDAIRAKFPNIIVKHLVRSQNMTVQDMISAGQVPDVMRTLLSNFDDYAGLGLAYDLQELVDLKKYDLKQFDKSYVDTMRNEGRSIDPANPNALYGLPINGPAVLVLFYNKDVFDTFGEPYPKDGMTWDEVYNLARKMTRTQGSISYRGMTMNYQSLLVNNQKSLPVLDPKADKMSSAGEWKTVFDNLTRFYQIPGNARMVAAAEGTTELNAFYRQRNVAMYIGSINDHPNFPENLNLDLVTMPQVAGAPNQISQSINPYWSITKQSKHKEAAFDVIAFLLSEEMQKLNAKQGIVPTLTKASVRQEFGKDVPVLQGKHVEAVFKYPFTGVMPARSTTVTQVPYNTGRNTLYKAFEQAADGQIDTNTALSQAEEAIVKEIQTIKSR
ncbi:MAG: hypothetical protein K0Q94_2839 [Paenibacillus sp.]|jgi:multiple sugar transport system substrate-binding protein|nr:hypothetical protein [Paenibacillus sp.]